MSGKIILTCVEEKKKLRIKFHMYIGEDGKRFTNAYNNSYNCRFPKAIRKKGRFFEINGNDLTTNISTGKPFYMVNKNNIKIFETDPYIIDETINIENIKDKYKIFLLDECLMCYCEVPCVILMPCGHQCSCKECFELIKNSTNICPLCRTPITQSFCVKVDSNIVV